MTNDSLKAAIRKYALKNAMDYGKASVPSVLNKVMVQAKEAGIPVSELKAYVESTVAEINSMGASQIESEYAAYKAEFDIRDAEKHEKSSKPKMELPGAEIGNFATRFPPEPNGYLHIGHAKPLFLEDAFRTIYKGKLFLYFDDTNPKNESQEYVDAIKFDLDWLGVKFDKEYYASDNIEKIYGFGRQLIKDSGAYACSCSEDKIKELRFKGIECEHRSRPPEESLDIFDKLVSGSYEEDKIAIRFKGDMKAANTTLRDPTIFRVVKARHYRQGDKYSLWPTYSFNTPINDSINGVTDAIRSKEYELANDLYYMVLNALHLRLPRVHLEARLNIEGNVTSKRKIVKFMREGLLSGFDDPRLVTIAALRRRGVVPEAIKNFVLRTGMSKVDSTFKLSMLLDESKRAIDPVAKRLFFVPDPVALQIEAFQAKASIPLHPTSKIGSRDYEVKGTVYISKADASKYKGSSIRLKGLGVFRISGSDPYRAVPESEKSAYVNTIQWIPGSNAVKCKILIPHDPMDGDEFRKDSLEYAYGLAEDYVRSLEVHETVQFERFGFCTLDRIDPTEFIFLTK